jgi:hypothetical protein
VGTKDISVRAKRNIILAPIVYIPFFVLELPLNLLLPTEAVPIISVIGIIITLLHVILIALNAILIYSCYMRICMPDEEKAEKETRGIGGFFEKSKKEHKNALLEAKSKDKNNV